MCIIHKRRGENEESRREALRGILRFVCIIHKCHGEMKNRGAKRRRNFYDSCVLFTSLTAENEKSRREAPRGILRCVCIIPILREGESHLIFTISYFQNFRMDSQLITALSAISYLTQNPGRQLID